MNKMKISSIDGNTQLLDGGSMFGNAPRALWQKWSAPDEQNRINLACRSMLVEIDGIKILCETGIGAFFEPKMAERFGVSGTTHKLLENLSALGISDSDIDAVILSHMHFDHAGGLLPSYKEIEAGNDGLLFPNAKYITGKVQFERCKKPHARDRASYIPGLADKLESSGRLTLVESEKIDLLNKKLSFIFTDGHTPGQMHSVFKEEGHSVFFAGDIVPGTAWLHIPITMGYDRYAERVIDEKTKIIETALDENWMFFYTHDPVHAASFAERSEKGRIQAKNSMKSLNKFSF